MPDLSGCISNLHSFNRLSMACSSRLASASLRQCATASSAYRENGFFGCSRSIHLSKAYVMNKFISTGPITEPCGTPLDRWTGCPSGDTAEAVSHRSMYSRHQGSLTCFAIAFLNRSRPVHRTHDGCQTRRSSRTPSIAGGYWLPHSRPIYPADTRASLGERPQRGLPLSC